MLTILTQEAIRVLRYIYYRDAGISCPPDSSDCAFRNVSVLLPLLERGGLIRCICPESPDSPVSYELCKPLGSIDLLSLLLILHEGCVRFLRMSTSSVSMAVMGRWPPVWGLSTR
ncbi:hypothetical protein NXV32_15960 [Bacteroides fragilis]|nr:hypothetical protein NXV32_15960 [Bacteroides fragilis]